jgi:hypothetical protein
MTIVMMICAFFLCGIVNRLLARQMANAMFKRLTKRMLGNLREAFLSRTGRDVDMSTCREADGLLSYIRYPPGCRPRGVTYSIIALSPPQDLPLLEIRRSNEANALGAISSALRPKDLFAVSDMSVDGFSHRIEYPESTYVSKM